MRYLQSPFLFLRCSCNANISDILNPYSVKATILGKEDNHLIINYKKQTTSLYDVNADGIFNINDRIISNTGSCTYKYDLINDINDTNFNKLYNDGYMHTLKNKNELDEILKN